MAIIEAGTKWSLGSARKEFIETIFMKTVKMFAKGAPPASEMLRKQKNRPFKYK